MQNQPTTMEPLSFSQILDKTFRIYGTNFVPLFVIVAIMYVPYIYLTMSFLDPTAMSTMDVGDMTSRASLMGLWFLLAYPIWSGATTYIVGKAYTGQSASVGKSFSVAFSKYVPMLVTWFLVTILIVVASLALVIPGIYVALGLVLVIPIILLEEGVSTTGSMGRSWELTKGNRWRMLGLFLVLGIINLILAQIATYIAGVVSPGSTSSQLLAQNVMSIVTTPLGTVLIVVLYYDIRVRKEAFDLELLSKAMDDLQ